MNSLRTILFISLFVTLFQANAGELCNSIALQINGVSKHLADGKHAKKEEFRGSNPGLGLVCQGNGSDWMAGAYKNSVYRDSIYIANNRYIRFGGTAKNTWHLDLGVAYGLATGYDQQKRIPKINNDIGVLGFITASAGQTHIGKINIAWLPTVMIAINLDIRIN